MLPLTKQFVLCLMLLCFGCSSASSRAIQPPAPTQHDGFYTKLRTDKTSVVLDVFFRNGTAKTIKVTHGAWDCVFRFEIWVNGKKYTYPQKQHNFLPNQPKNAPENQFREMRTCPAMAYTRSVDKKSSLRFATIKLPDVLAKALRDAKMKYSGQFYLYYSTNQEPLRLEIGKIP